MHEEETHLQEEETGNKQTCHKRREKDLIDASAEQTQKKKEQRVHELGITQKEA